MKLSQTESAVYGAVYARVCAFYLRAGRTADSAAYHAAIEACEAIESMRYAAAELRSDTKDEPGCWAPNDIQSPHDE